MPRRGFTLMELLVVISVIAMLAALLLPAIGVIRAQSKRLECASRLRICSAAFSAYAVDSEGLMPVARTVTGQSWFELLAPFVDLSGPRGPLGATRSSVLACPTYRSAFNPWNWTSWTDENIHSGDRQVFGFGMNVWPLRSATITSLGTAAENRAWKGSVDHLSSEVMGNAALKLYPRWNEISQTANRVLLADSNEQTLQIEPDGSGWENATAALASRTYHFRAPEIHPGLAGTDPRMSAVFFPTDRHRGRVNVSYYDGRVGSCAVNPNDGFEFMLGVCFPEKHKGF